MDPTSSFYVMVIPLHHTRQSELIDSGRDSCLNQKGLHGRSQRAPTNRGELFTSVLDQADDLLAGEEHI